MSFAISNCQPRGFVLAVDRAIDICDIGASIYLKQAIYVAPWKGAQ